MNIKRFAVPFAAAILSTSATAAAPGNQGNSGQYAISISGFVPVICRATVGATIIPGNATMVDLGGLSEFCNSPNGYEVYADYAPALSSATLIVDGQKVNLSKTGTTRVSKENRATIITHSLVLDMSKSGPQNAALSFRVVPL